MTAAADLACASTGQPAERGVIRQMAKGSTSFPFYASQRAQHLVARSHQTLFAREKDDELALPRVLCRQPDDTPYHIPN